MNKKFNSSIDVPVTDKINNIFFIERDRADNDLH